MTDGIKNFRKQLISVNSLVALILFLAGLQLDDFKTKVVNKISKETSIAEKFNSIDLKLDYLTKELAKSNSVTLEPFVINNELKDKYVLAKDFFIKGEYEISIETLNAILQDKSYNTENKTDLAYVNYWLGENEVGLGQYSDALKYFEKVLTDQGGNLYISSQKRLATIYMIAKCYDKLKNYSKAKLYYNQLIEESKYNYCQPIFEIARKRLVELN